MHLFDPKRVLPAGWILATLFFAIATTQTALASDPSSPRGAQAELIPTDVASEARIRSDIRLVFSGGSMGVGAGKYSFQVPGLIEAHNKDKTTRIKEIRPLHGILVQSDFTLWTEDKKAESVVRFLKAGPIVCDDPGRAVELRSPSEQIIILEAPELANWFSELPIPNTQREPLATRTCTNREGAKAILSGLAFDAPEPPSWKIESFEFRLALDLIFETNKGDSTAIIVGIPAREAARRFRHLKELLKEKNHTFYVDAGSFIDGTSAVRDGSLSLHRKWTLETLSSLGATALAPADTELIAGARNLIAESKEKGLPYIASNWSTKDPQLQLPRFLIREVPDPAGTIRLAFLAVTDPAAAKWIPSLEAEGLILLDPVESVNSLVEELHESETPPDLVVVLTTGRPHMLSKMKSGLRGVDLVLGDRSDVDLRLNTFDIEVKQEIDPKRRVAAILPIEDITSADLTFSRIAGSWSLKRIENRPHRIKGSFPPDTEALSQITRTRASVYPGRDRILLPAPSGVPSRVWKGEEWASVVCEALVAKTDADAVLLPRLPEPPQIPGPLTELMIMDRLALLDKLEEHEIPGDKLVNLLGPAKQLVSQVCGAQLKPSLRIRGRAIDPDRIYKVVTTDRASAGLLEALLSRAYSPRLLDQPAYRILQDERGNDLTLRHAVLSHLRLRAIGYGNLEKDPNQEEPSAQRLRPQWSLKIQRLSLRATRFEGSRDERFAQVQETLATSPSTFNLATDTDISIIYDTGILRNDFRFRGTYSELSFDDGNDEELADDLRLSFSSEVPRFGFKITQGSPAFSPYGEILLDTEFSPIETDGKTLSRQADISLTTGLSARKFGDFKMLRVGAFVLSDLSNSDRFADYGGRAEAQTLTIFGPGLRFSTTLDARLYGSTPDDDPSDLRYKALLDARLAAPLIRFLDLSVFAQTFFFKGRVEETKSASSSYTLGFSLDFRGVFDI